MKQYPPVSFISARVALLASFVVLASCADHTPHRIAFASTDAVPDAPTPAHAQAAARPAPTSDGRVVLVTIDGVRPEDVFDGADPSLRPDAKVAHLTKPEAVMPHVHRLVATRGVAIGADRRGCGTVRTASGANVSLPGYLEIFTGRKTRCRDNHCARTAIPTVLDEAADAGLAPVASIGSWELLDRAVSRGSSSVLIADGATRWTGPRPIVDAEFEKLVTAGEQADPYPGGGKYRPDEHTAAVALAYFKSAAPPVLHVGLGDADEYGHRNDYAAYLEAIGKADAFIGRLADTLDGMGEVGARTTVIVTTDHGRNRDFRHHGAFSLTSARTFVIAFSARMPARGVVCPSRDVTLADIAPTMREILGLAPDRSPDAGHAIEEIIGARQPAEIAAVRPEVRRIAQ